MLPLYACVLILHALNDDYVLLSRMMPNLPLHCWDQLLLHHLLRVKTPSHLQKLGVVRDYLINIPTFVSQYCLLAWG